MAQKEMTIDTRFEYLQLMQKRYRMADRRRKAALLDEMEAITQLGRKHLIAVMHGPDLVRHARSRERQRTYDDEVVQTIMTLADALDWICAERLQPTLRPTAEHLIGFGALAASPEVLDKLERISAPTLWGSVATLGRILQRIRPSERLPRAYPGRRAETSAQQAVPIAIIPWDVLERGHFEVDLLHHGVPDRNGKLVCTIQFVDVLTGWSERFAIMGWTFDAIWQALQTFKRHCPFPARELHSDNGSEFINMPLVAYFGEELVGTTQTRGRPGHHNDNRFVEQKNSSLVRAYLGTLSLHTHAQLQALNALYEDMWLFYNFFQPVLRQTARTAVTGSDGVIRIRRQQDRACTPYERLVWAKPALSRETHERLQALYDQTNPLELKQRIHAQIRALRQMANQPE